MDHPSPELLAAPLVARVVELVAQGVPLFVGLDGPSGSGKSTVASVLEDRLGAVGTPVLVIEGDDFYAGGSAATWDARTPAERADRVIDWRRQRDVLARLRAEGLAEWRRFDWDAEAWDGDPAPLAPAPVRVVAAPVVVLEGAYSCRPELHDLLDLRVLLDVAVPQRREQLLGREGDDFDPAWDRRWSSAEGHYFAEVMPPGRFDLVLGGTGGGAPGAASPFRARGAGH